MKLLTTKSIVQAFFLVSVLAVVGCKDNPCDDNPCLNGGTCIEVDDTYRCDCPAGLAGTNCESNPLDTVGYDPQPYDLNLPAIPTFLQPNIPADNPLTVDGVQLGRMLFYDPILSGDSTMSCAGCHFQEFAFTDRERAFSLGIDGIAGNRNSMPIFNLVFFRDFFWDGRSRELEDQALEPVPNPIELHLEWPEGEARLRRHADYPRLFKKAFNISTANDIDRELVAKAIAQFERSIISVDSKYDRVLRGEEDFTDLESDGQILFVTDDGVNTDLECLHCHNHADGLFTDNRFRNNGITAAATPDDFPDLGKGGITGNDLDKGKFKTPSLRNIEKTAPYIA